MWCAVTEREVQCGMLQSQHPSDTSFCITRHITNLLDNIHRSRAHKFIDVVTNGDTAQPSSATVDVDAQCMLSSLRFDKIASVLGPEGMVHFDVEWFNVEEGNPNEDEVYLSEFMEVFESKMMHLIERAVLEQRSTTRDSHVVELMQHLTVCRQRSQVCCLCPITLST